MSDSSRSADLDDRKFLAIRRHHVTGAGQARIEAVDSAKYLERLFGIRQVKLKVDDAEDVAAVRLLRRVLRVASERNADTVFLEVRESNAIAQAL